VVISHQRVTVGFDHQLETLQHLIEDRLPFFHFQASEVSLGVHLGGVTGGAPFDLITEKFEPRVYELDDRIVQAPEVTVIESPCPTLPPVADRAQ
jgi:hypothetical protein